MLLLYDSDVEVCVQPADTCPSVGVHVYEGVCVWVVLCFTKYAKYVICLLHTLLVWEDMHKEVWTQREIQQAEPNKHYHRHTST